MKNLLFTLLSLTIVFTPLLSQEKPEDLGQDEKFIYFFDNTLLREGEFEIKKGFLVKRFYHLNGDKINYDDMKFFQDNSGYYGSIVGKGLFGGEFKEIVKRTETGEVDLFVKYDYNNDGTSSKRYYFAKGFNDVKRLEYENLKQALVLKPETSQRTKYNVVLSHLEKGKKDKKTANTLLISGITTCLVGMLIYDTDQQALSSRNITSLSIFTAGLGTSLTTTFFKKEKSYLEAVRAFNLIYE